MTHPIPTAALDDRLGFVGNTGSGKTYSSGTAVERLLAAKSRVVIPDPLGVWYGLALSEDGKSPSAARARGDLVVFGGPRGDLPLNEYAGALIGETVAGMKESCILDLSELGTKAAERRFMLAFLSALYKHKTNEPLHVVFDEADMWAPQRILDKEGEAMKLLGMMETVVRRGRVKGFIPWLITQRPAVLSKNVLSQIDGMVAFKLTSVQDRDAIGDWVEGQADKAQWKAMWAELATLELGQGVVWIPGRDILKTAQFPQKITFDSSRAPKRGEQQQNAIALEPVNIDKLKVRLSKVEAETKANDPKALRAEVQRLTTELAKGTKPAVTDFKAIEAASAEGFERGLDYLRATVAQTAAGLSNAMIKINTGYEELRGVERAFQQIADPPPRKRVPVPPRSAPSGTPLSPSRAKPSTPLDTTKGKLAGPLKKIVDAIAWWSAFGIDQPTRTQVAFVAGYKPNTGTFNTYLGRLSSIALLSASSPGRVVLTEIGLAAADVPPTPHRGDLHDRVRAVLDGPLTKILNVLIEQYPDDMTRPDLAMASGYQPGTGTFNTYLGRLNSIGLTDTKPDRVTAAAWLFP